MTFAFVFDIPADQPGQATLGDYFQPGQLALEKPVWVVRGGGPILELGFCLPGLLACSFVRS